LLEFTELLAAELVEKGLPVLPIEVTVDTVEGEDYASANMLGASGEAVDTGPIERCQIVYDPTSAAWFEQSDDDPSALRRISIVATHELVHCVEFAVAGVAQRVLQTPAWIDEGAADWAAFLVVAPESPAPSDVSEWGEFFDPRIDLFRRDYDAVGFWSAVHRLSSERAVWDLLRFAWSLPWESAAGSGSTELSNDVLRRAAADPEFLARWAMSYVRMAEFGGEWETTGPGLGDEHPPAAHTAPMVAGDVLLQRANVRGFGYVEFQFAEGVDVVRVTPRGHGALHWGREDDGPDDVFTGVAADQAARFYCRRADGCPCPNGMRLRQGLDLPVRPYGGVTVSFFGDHETTGPLQPQVEVAALPLADAIAQVCEDAVVIDFTVCDTWASHEELLMLVPGSDHVTGPQDVGAPGGPWACLWTVVGPPLADPMFFEWTVDVWPFLVARTDQTAEEWNAFVAQIEQEKECAPIPLGADGVPACVARTEDSMDVVVRLGADHVLWLRLDTLDYPVAQFHGAGEQLALFFATRLAP
jgi:hypothetical protein